MISLYVMKNINNYHELLDFIDFRIQDKVKRHKTLIHKKAITSAELLLNYAFYQLFKNEISYPIKTSLDKSGKPLYLGKNIHFNKSHTSDYSLVVISNQEVGCDIEKIIEKHQLVKKVLDEIEYEFYLSKAEEEQKILFTKYWTAKESYIKLFGKGISPSIKQYHYQYLDVDNNQSKGKINSTKIFQSWIEDHIVACAYNDETDLNVKVATIEEINRFIDLVYS